MPPNRILVHRQGLIDSYGGIQLADHEDRAHEHLPNFGVVKAVCNRLNFTRDLVLELKRQGRDRREIQEASRRTCQYLTPIEVKVGDTVIYRRLNNVSDMENVHQRDGDDATLVIQHDDLIARIESNGSIYPLAGNLIVCDTFPENVTRVVAAGLPVLEYFDHPGYKDADDMLVGRMVVANMRHAAPMCGYNSVLAHSDEYILSGKTSLAYIKRRHILAIIDET